MKKVSIIFFTFFLGIFFLNEDTISQEFPKDDIDLTYHPKELHHVSADENNPLIDSLLVYADQLGEKLNGVVLIARNDTILVEKSYGYLELFRNAKGYSHPTNETMTTAREKASNLLTSNTLFDLASISKQFTAAAILKLCHDGQISLTDSLGQYIPGTPYSKVTIKQLLTHNSGIPEYFNFEYSLYGTTPFVTNNQLIKVFQKSTAQWLFQPGWGYSYCNTNYAFLASIVACVANMPFEQYVRDNLWNPAGMKETYFFTELVGLYPNHHQPDLKMRIGQEFANVRTLDSITNNPISRGHFRSGILAQYDRLNGVLGDKGVYTTAEDLVRWTNAYFIHCSILPEKEIEQATQMQNKTKRGIIPKDQYGYGLHLEEKGNGFVIYHGGLWNGYHNLWLYRPSDNIQIIFLSNFYNASHPGQSKLFLDLIDKM